MKKITILLIVTCMLLSGCGVRISMADENVDIESSVGLFNQHSSFMIVIALKKMRQLVK